MDLSLLIEPLGITAYTFLFLAALTGLMIFKFKVTRIKLKHHMWLGIVALALATFHAVVILYLNK